MGNAWLSVSDSERPCFRPMVWLSRKYLWSVSRKHNYLVITVAAAATATALMKCTSRRDGRPSPHLNSAPFSLFILSSFLPSFLPAPFCMRRRRRLVLFPVCVKHQVGGGGKGRVAVVKVVKGRKFGATCKKTRIAPLSDSFAGLE